MDDSNTLLCGENLQTRAQALIEHHEKLFKTMGGKGSKGEVKIIHTNGDRDLKITLQDGKIIDTIDADKAKFLGNCFD